jgi:hypothetical protein
MRFLVTHPSETRPSLLVHTCAAVNEAEVNRMRDAMFGLGCANGLLFDREQCVLLRDTFSSRAPASILAEGAPLRTDDVLANAGSGSLDARVTRWLEMLSTNWNSALPIDGAIAAPFLADVVPAASGSTVYATLDAA